jgi:hypothetical protein
MSRGVQAFTIALAFLAGRTALACPFCEDAAGSGKHDFDFVGTLLVAGAGLFVLRAFLRRVGERAKIAARGSAPQPVDGARPEADDEP